MSHEITSPVTCVTKSVTYKIPPKTNFQMNGKGKIWYFNRKVMCHSLRTVCSQLTWIQVTRICIYRINKYTFFIWTV